MPTGGGMGSGTGGGTVVCTSVGATCTSSQGFAGICRQDPNYDTVVLLCIELVCDSRRPSCGLCGLDGQCVSNRNSEKLCISPLGPMPKVGGTCTISSPVVVAERFASAASTGTCSATGVCQAGGAGVKSDPIITGFDGKPFHFDQTGEFTLLSSGDGLRVDVTFAGASTEAKEEKSWTSSVRFLAPNGDMVACALPAIQPNTSRVQVSAMPAQAPLEVSLLSSRSPSAELEEMTAAAVLSESGQVTGCQVTTSRLQATVYQVSGYEQALLHPEEAWAAPYTWLNTDVKLLKPLPAPVTGILGGTYPVDKEAETQFLRALEEPGGVGAGVVGEPAGTRRGLSGVASPVFLESSIVGLAKS
ncbi:hypothetical protein N2152v2_008149 [Parachlorella kessleri]